MKILCGVLLALSSVLADARMGKVLGEVTAIEGGRVTVRADDGRVVAVTTDSTTKFMKTRPGAASLDGALPTALADLVAGDRILAAGLISDGALTARHVVMMSRGDLAEKQAHEREDWRRRGLNGVVTAVDPAAEEITVRNRAQGEAALVVVSTVEKKARLRCYAADSVTFADAKPCAFGDVEVGDQVRALGDRSPDGGRFLAEHVVAGAFRTLVGTVEELDVPKGELRLLVGASERVLVSIGTDSTLRRLPADLALQMSTRGGKGGPPNLGDLLDRMPSFELAALKRGDRLAISSTRGADAARVSAIIVVAGIEPLLAANEGGRRPTAPALMPGLPSGALEMGMGGM
jgi:hypothetical protein